MNDDFTAPDPYSAGIAARRAAEATPESRFAEQHRAARLRDLDAEHAQVGAHVPRLTAAELKQFEAPDGYQLALAAMRQPR